MQLSLKYKRLTIVTALMIISVFALTKCITNEKEKKEEGKEKADTVAYTRKISFEKFAGSATCANCHKDIFAKHIKTGHYLTSQPALEKFVLGSFKPGKNEYDYSPLTKVVMEKRDSGLFQVVYQQGEERYALHFDIVTGSGAKGQSYLYWRNNRLFQMPVTYYTAADQWSNSPGFPDKVVLNRPITSRCLECHATYADIISTPGKEPEEFDHNKMLFGVDCEKCHGPGAEHVEFQTRNPADTRGKYMINPASFTRQQNLDLCGLCHGGALEKLKPSFEYVAGEPLSNYFKEKKISNPTPMYDNVDVHGNQLGLLKASKCFTASNLTCNNCHNTHENERGKTALFSQRCMTCHQPGHSNFCTIKSIPRSSLKANCIDCHMPATKSQAITLLLPGQSVPTAASVRSHFIAVYPQKVKDFVTGKEKSRSK
ncbi:multiheme c-type cytochrome [Terrimonas alba]|uniref:multiheme c-type cytochrome n=1 Tax=Terrimonas alba TaxID=3349636 RepID=UPI0035F2BE83